MRSIFDHPPRIGKAWIKVPFTFKSCADSVPRSPHYTYSYPPIRKIENIFSSDLHWSKKMIKFDLMGWFQAMGWEIGTLKLHHFKVEVSKFSGGGPPDPTPTSLKWYVRASKMHYFKGHALPNLPLHASQTALCAMQIPDLLQENQDLL